MSRPIESTEVCPYCGEIFYLAADCEDHVKSEHLDFGSDVHIAVDPQSDTCREPEFHRA